MYIQDLNHIWKSHLVSIFSFKWIKNNSNQFWLIDSLEMIQLKAMRIWINFWLKSKLYETRLKHYSINSFLCQISQIHSHWLLLKWHIVYVMVFVQWHWLLLLLMVVITVRTSQSLHLKCHSGNLYFTISQK